MSRHFSTSGHLPYSAKQAMDIATLSHLKDWLDVHAQAQKTALDRAVSADLLVAQDYFRDGEYPGVRSIRTTLEEVGVLETLIAIRAEIIYLINDLARTNEPA